MSQQELDPEAAKALDRMVGPPPSHSRFVGAPIDWSGIDALALGDLWATAYRLIRCEAYPPPPGVRTETARAVLMRGRDMEPAFRGPACRDFLELLAAEAEALVGQETFLRDTVWSEARTALARCVEPGFGGLRVPLERLLAALEWRWKPHLALAMARLLGRETQVLEQLAVELADAPLLVEELRTAAALDLAAELAMDTHWYPAIADVIGDRDDGIERLAEDPAYAVFAETALRQAAERVRGIHDRVLPYASDKAFTPDEAVILARLSRVALARDEPWLPPVLDELFRKVSIAPTAAKTLPSQAVAIALSHAVEAFPTPEAVATLRAVLQDIRHAGVKKKLQRDLRGAERRLADRPEIALRLPPGQPVSKQQLTTLTRCLEAGFATAMTLDYDDWRARLAEHPQAKALAGGLVWRLLDANGGGVSMLPAVERGHLVLRDATDAPVSPPEACRVTLWHPCAATAAEREAWRDRIAALRIRQPFKQVFREHYAVPAAELAGNATSLFVGHAVAVRPFLGLARRERWGDRYGCLERSFGPHLARLDLADDIYPGRGGGTTIGKVTLWTSRGDLAEPLALGALPAATLSEILRAVDLLVSVGGYAVDDEPVDFEREMNLWRLAGEPLGAMAEMRKHALQHALRGVSGEAEFQFDARHLRIGDYAIHLATGRVTRDGDPVTVVLPARPKLAAVPWLPYDEKLLETIYYTAVEIMARHAADAG